MVRAAIAGFAALALTACTARKEAATDTSAARESTAARRLAAPSRAARGGKEPVGTLAKPIEQYTGDELRDFVQRLGWTGGHERQRRCTGNAGCSGAKPGKTTLVRIDAVDTEDSLTTRGLPADGVIAARLANRGSLTEERYGLKPGGQYEYYLIVYGGDSTGTWRLEELEHSSSGFAHREIGRGVFKGCNHPFVPGARADFKSCENAAGSGQMKLMLQGSDPTLTDPIWFACSMGCCLAAAS